MVRALVQSVFRLVVFCSTTRTRRQGACASKPARRAAACVRRLSQVWSLAMLDSADSRDAASLAENGRIWTVPSQSAVLLVGRYSSSTVWKLEPPNPKALTAARRGAPSAEIQGRFFEAR